MIEQKLKTLTHVSELTEELKKSLIVELSEVFKDWDKELKIAPQDKHVKIHPLWKQNKSYDFNMKAWFDLYEDLKSICENIFLVNDIEFETHKTTRYSPQGSFCGLNEKHTNGLIKTKLINIISAYPSKIIDLILNDGMRFSEKYLEFIYPLIPEIQNNLKNNISTRLFKNYLYGILSSSSRPRIYKNIPRIECSHSMDVVTNFYFEILYESYTRTDDIIYIDTDIIFVRNQEHTIGYITNILEINNIRYEIDDKTDIGYFSTKKRYMLFDSNMDTIKTPGMMIKE